MNKEYFISIRPGLTGIHMIHSSDCPFLPRKNKRILLGEFHLTGDAETAGEEYFDKPCMCPFCSKEPGKVVSRAADHLLNTPSGNVKFEYLTPAWDSALMCGVN